MHTAIRARGDTENWHYDKYKDPHEFPNLDLENNADATTTSSSVNISKKLPKISDEKFKKILELRKNSNNNRKSEPAPPILNIPPESDLLSASTPKLTTNTVNIEKSEVSTSKKNISPLLLQSNKDDDIEDLLKESKSNDLDKLLDLLKEQAIQINHLETELAKRDIKIENYANNAIIIEDENKKLHHKLSTYEIEISSLYTKVQGLEDSNLQNNEFIGKLEHELKREKSLGKKEMDMHKKVLTNYDSNYEILSVENSQLKSQIKTLDDQIDNLTSQNINYVDDILKLKTQLDTKTQILEDKISKLQHENDLIKLENQTLIMSNKSLIESNEKQMKKIIGNSKAIDFDCFKDKKRYEYLEMNKIDSETLIELQNKVKNILNSLNLKYTDLKPFTVFIRDDITNFFNEVHSLLHCKKINNMLVIDNSVKLDVNDHARMRACMELLLKDIKKLKGAQ